MRCLHLHFLFPPLPSWGKGKERERERDRHELMRCLHLRFLSLLGYPEKQPRQARDRAGRTDGLTLYILSPLLRATDCWKRRFFLYT